MILVCNFQFKVIKYYRMLSKSEAGDNLMNDVTVGDINLHNYNYMQVTLR
jgi:pantothenate kinase